MLIPMNPNELFHVHTYRCGHAGTEQDYEYIEKAITMGVSKISFTDHAPFPGDMFHHRMKMEQLPDYLHTLTELKKKYQNHIDISIGLEIEYIREFTDYYHQLKAMKELDFLMIGQHFYAYEPGSYSFYDRPDIDLDIEEAPGFINAIIDGIKTGLFSYVAHPDRSFRRRKIWTPDMEVLSKRLLEASVKYNIPLEKNASSMRNKGQYWDEFWNYLEHLTPDYNLPIVLGLDAHCTDDLELKWK